MQLIRGIDQLSNQHRPSVVSIGNYDGVHLGHQYVIKTLLAQSQALNAAATVITFDPLAKEFFQPNSVARLSTVEERAQWLFNLGVDQVLCVEFNADFAATSPDAFIEDVLVKGLGAKYVCVGDDFRFGKGRAGDFTLLQSAGKQHGFEVSAHQTFELEGERVSSGRVRAALQYSDFQLAADLLGRIYSISGQVAMGQQLGRTLDFPTANIPLVDRVLAVNGVFAVVAVLESGERVKGVANIGNRPTVDGKEQRLEVHLFDFDRDIYGQNLSVELHSKIRDEKKFNSLDELKTQIAQDAAQAIAFLQSF